ncbi:MAG: preprotein translocase subunit SecE [Planctomycetes bacterium]|nr:preprotein translocase subunit SecE [Planctomycetota bacterium]
MFNYRPGEGGIARATAFWSLAGFAFFAGHRFYLWSQRFEFFDNDLLGSEIPVLGMPLTPGFIGGLVLFAIAVYGIRRLVNAPKIADLLIDTELEMKKVTWPSFDEARKASVIVIACIVVLTGFLLLADFGLERFFFDVLYGGSADGR